MGVDKNHIIFDALSYMPNLNSQYYHNLWPASVISYDNPWS